MRTYLLVLIHSLFINTLSAQNQAEADSLIELLSSAKSNDSTELILLHRIGLLSASPDKQIDYSIKLLNKATELNHQYFIGQALKSIGTAHRFKGDLKKSLDYLFMAASHSENHGLLKTLGEVYIEIAGVYTGNNDISNALLYHSKAIGILRRQGRSQELAINLLNFGYNFYINEQFDSALVYYNEAEPIFEEIDLQIGKAYTIGNRALIYWKQGNSELAIRDLQRAIEMLEPLGDQYGMADYYNQLGNIYLEKGMDFEAIACTARGLEMAKSEDLKEQVRDASKLLSELYQQQGEYEKSLQYLSQYIAYKDSIQDQETTQRLADLRTEFEVGQKQAELDLVESEKEAQRTQSIIIGSGLTVVLLLIGMLAFVQYRNSVQRKATNQVLSAQKEELEDLNSTKDKFFSIISHDLRGPISSFSGVSRLIEAFARSKNTDDLIELAHDIDYSSGKLSELLDNLLSWATQQQGKVPHNPEKLSVNSLANTIQSTLQNMADSKSIQLSVKVDQEVFAFADRNTSETILRNLVSNALKFTPEKGQVAISVKGKSKFVEIAVSDTGVGIPEDKLKSLFELEEKKSTYGTGGEKGLGVGLQLVEEFGSLNNGELNVESVVDQGSTFAFTLPLYVD